MKKIINLLIIALLLFSCSPQKRLSRLLTHHPELMQTDTMYVNDTVIIDPYVIDTIFDLPVMADTVIVEKEKIKVQVIKQPVPGKIRVVVERRTDTIYINKPVYVNKIVYPIKDDSRWYDSLWFKYICLIISILIIFMLLFKSTKTQ